METKGLQSVGTEPMHLYGGQVSQQSLGTLMSCQTCQEQKQAQPKEHLLATAWSSMDENSTWPLWTQQTQLPGDIGLLL